MEQPSYTDLMLDLETLGLKPGCIVLSAAMMRFDRFADIDYYQAAVDDRVTFSITFSMTRQLAAGLLADPKTLEWYYKAAGQLPIMIQSAQETAPIDRAIGAVEQFMIDTQKAAPGKNVCLWANSPNFDIEILLKLFEISKMDLPFDFRKWMDVRTIREAFYSIYGEVPSGDKTKKHAPEYDCAWQCMVISKFFSRTRQNHETVEKIIAASKGQSIPGEYKGIITSSPVVDGSTLTGIKS